MPRVRLVRHSLRRLPAPLRPPRKGHQGFGNCFSAVLQFPKIPLVFAPSRNWRVGRSLGNWDSGIGLMMDVPSAAFVIRSFARHSVGHSGMEYNERGAGIRRRRSLPVVLFPFTNHDAASASVASQMCIRRNSTIFLAPCRPQRRHRGLRPRIHCRLRLYRLLAGTN